MASTVSSAVINLLVAIIGCGILSLPKSFKDSGILWGFIMLSCCACFAFISTKLLTISASALQHQFPNHNIVASYSTLAMISGGFPLALFAQIVIILSLWGSASTRILGSTQIIIRLYSALFDIRDKDQLFVIKIVIISILSVIIMFPLGLIQNISSLHFTSTLSFFSFVVLSLCFIVELVRCGNGDTLCFIELDSSQITQQFVPSLSLHSVFRTIPMFLFLFNGHCSIFPIDLYRDSNAMSLVLISSIVLSSSLYTVTGVSGSLLLLDETPGNILDHDFSDRVCLVLIQILISLSMILTLPTFVIAIRCTVMDISFLLNPSSASSQFVFDPNDMQPLTTLDLSDGLLEELPVTPSSQTLHKLLGYRSFSVTNLSFKFIPTFSRRKPISINTPRHYNALQIYRIQTCEGLAMSHVHHSPHPLVSLNYFYWICTRRGTFCKSDDVSLIDSAVDPDEVNRDEHILDIDMIRLKRGSSSKVISLLTPRNDSNDGDDVESEKKKCPSALNQLNELIPSNVILTMIISIALTVPTVFVDDIVVIIRVMGCTVIPILGYLLPTYFVLWFVPFTEHPGMIVFGVLMCMVIAVVSLFASYQQICDVIGIGDGL